VQQPGNGGAVCRAAAGACDVAEVCTGTSGACPVDAKSTAVCRASAGACDFAESCDGISNNCPADGKSVAVCRASAGACDLAETCDGTSDTCPPDVKSTATCRASAGACDLAETCDGSSNNCPADAKSTATCRASAGACDIAEQCDGVNSDCPPDAKSTATCRASAAECDAAESCDGVSNDCPADTAVPDNSSCSGGLCCGGACTATNVAQSTSPVTIYPNSVKTGYSSVSTITNCGACGNDCGGAAEGVTQLCVPQATGMGECRQYDRAQCSEAEPSCTQQDLDGDGLTTEWETPQPDPYASAPGTLNPAAGVDLNCDGEISDAGGDLIWHEAPRGDATKDIYVELDFMQGTGFILDPTLGVIPEPFDHAPPVNPLTGVDAVAAVQAAFAREDIALHVAVEPVPHAQLLSFPQSPGDLYCATSVDPVTGEPAQSFYDYKTDPANHDPRRRIGYHYFISGHDACADSASGLAEATGVAEVNGNDAIVSMGSFRYWTPCDGGVCASTADRVRRYREWAGTFMHELGHNLGLCHDGPADASSPSPCDDANVNHAPNNISVMNYSFQLAWIPRSQTIGTISPLDPTLPLRLDFSHGVEGQLDESALDERVGLNVSVAPFNRDVTRYFCDGFTFAAPSSGPIDWNCDGRIDENVLSDINNDGMIEFLPSSNEWDSLLFDFQCQPAFSD
jgi:hypothetical protein